MWKIQFYFYQINGAFSKYHSTHSVIKVLINQKQKKKFKKSFIIFFEKSSFIYQMDGTKQLPGNWSRYLCIYKSKESKFQTKKNLS